MSQDNSVYTNVRAFLEQQPGVAKSLEKSSSPNILFTTLPKHWRSNKSFQDQFVVVILTPVPDNTEVTIWAGNDEAPCGEIRNEKTRVHRQIAKFNDLRFVGRSGRGRNFHLTIVIHSTPMMVATVKNAIKVTVDGPREARIPKPAGLSSSQSPSDQSTQPTTIPIPTMIPTLPQMLPSTAAAVFWPWQLIPQPPPSSFFPMIPVTSSTVFPLPANISSSKIRAPFINTVTTTPNKSLNDSENECLNTSTSTSSPPTTIPPLSAPSSTERTSKRRLLSPKHSPSSISLTQCTPDEEPSKMKRRRRNASTTSSSNGSSPTIWRPFE